MVSPNSYPSALSKTLSHTSPYASAIFLKAVLCTFSASRGFDNSARRGDDCGSMVDKKVENADSEEVRIFGDVVGRRDRGIYLQFSVRLLSTGSFV